ncbi:MAG: AMP-binding protein [Myxococcota bacterium]
MFDGLRSLRGFGSRPALVESQGTTSFAELAALVSAEADRLTSLGLAPGDRCGLVCGEDRATVVRALALLEAGGVVLPLSGQLGVEELRQAEIAFEAQWRLQGAGAGAFERSAFECARSGDAVAARAAAAPVQGLFSSGSTGRPKIVLRSAPQLRAYTQIYAEAMSLSPDDRVAVLLPFSFAYGFNSLMLGSLAAGASLVFPGSRNPRRVLSAIREGAVTILAATPTLLDLMVRFAGGASGDLAGVRICVATGEPLSRPLAQRFRETFGKALWNNYGSSETGPMTLDREGTADGEAIALGRPYPGVEIGLRDEQGDPAPDGQVGEIVVRSPALGLGHAGRDGAVEAFEAGGFATGDLGVFRGGVLFFAGRRKLLINAAGRKVDPLEVEQAMRRHPRIVDAAVVGHPEGDREVVRALVVAEGSVTAGELMDFCSASLAAYKVPRIIEFRSALPRSESGKLIRTRL